jgi:hypothetical protein
MKKTMSPSDPTTSQPGPRGRMRLRRLTLRRLTPSEMNGVIGGARIEPTAEPLGLCHTVVTFRR